MRQLRNKNSLFALSWLAILLAATASADVVEDLVFEPFEANAAESPLPQPDLEDPAENATVRSVSRGRRDGGRPPGWRELVTLCTCPLSSRSTGGK